MSHDAWLERWLPALAERARGGTVLEVGCGSGDDTRTLVDAGLRVVAFDLSPEQLAQAEARVPGAEFHCRSVLDPFPLAGTGVPAVVASLSLHYFPWRETLQVFERLRQTLAPGGLLLCRLNSTEDHHFGASGHSQIEPHYFLVDGAPKRFFDRAHVEALFASGWRVRSMVHGQTGKYGPLKSLWEVAAERAA